MTWLELALRQPQKAIEKKGGSPAPVDRGQPCLRAQISKCQFPVKWCNTGWWLSPTPLKMSSSVGLVTFPIYGKSKKHVPKHQPEHVWNIRKCCMIFSNLNAETMKPTIQTVPRLHHRSEQLGPGCEVNIFSLGRMKKDMMTISSLVPRSYGVSRTWKLLGWAMGLDHLLTPKKTWKTMGK